MEIIADIFIGFGAFLVLTSALGIIKMPDFYTRLHPAGISDTAGVIVIMLGLAFHLGFGVISLKLIFLTILAVATSATSCHALAKAALSSGLKPIGKIHEN